MASNVLTRQPIKTAVRPAIRTVSAAERELVWRLLLVQESKDPDTGVHSMRLGALAGLLAVLNGASGNYVWRIFWAAPLHDVGKMGIPDRVLQKPGQLDAEEWELMRSHTTIGARMLSCSNGEVIRMASEIALHHHERFDGTGYPVGLKGAQIPLAARIVAVADFFDALTMERCYRPRFSDEEAKEMILQAVCQHLDPALVRLMTDRWSDFVLIRDSISNTKLLSPFDGDAIRRLTDAAAERLIAICPHLQVEECDVDEAAAGIGAA